MKRDGSGHCCLEEAWKSLALDGRVVCGWAQEGRHLQSTSVGDEGRWPDTKMYDVSQQMWFTSPWS